MRPRGLRSIARIKIVCIGGEPARSEMRARYWWGVTSPNGREPHHSSIAGIMRMRARSVVLSRSSLTRTCSLWAWAPCPTAPNPPTVAVNRLVVFPSDAPPDSVLQFEPQALTATLHRLPQNPVSRCNLHRATLARHSAAPTLTPVPPETVPTLSAKPRSVPINA